MGNCLGLNIDRPSIPEAQPYTLDIRVSFLDRNTMKPICYLNGEREKTVREIKAELLREENIHNPDEYNMVVNHNEENITMLDDKTFTYYSNHLITEGDGSYITFAQRT